MVAPHGPSIFTDFQPADPSPLTPSGPVTITSDSQVVEDLDITATGGSSGITVTAGKINWIIRRCRIRHATGGHGISIPLSGSDGGTIQDCDIEHSDWEGLSAYAGFDSSNQAIAGESADNLTITRVRCTGGSGGIYLLTCANPTVSFIEGHHMRGLVPRGQLLQFDKCTDGEFTDFSVINNVNSDRTNDLVNFGGAIRCAARRGLLQGGTHPTGTGILCEDNSGTSEDITFEDIDCVDSHNGGCHNANVRVANANSHPAIFRRCRVRDLKTIVRYDDGGGGIPSSSAGGTQSPLYYASWNHASALTLIEDCNYHYLAAENSDLPIALEWEPAKFNYTTSKAVDLAFDDFVPRAAISLTMPWE
jgi:hypothetical protein